MKIYIYSIIVIVIALEMIGANAKKERIKLKDIEVLTLSDGELTTGRRTKPIRQLQCVGGTASCKHRPSVVQCYNRGFDGRSVQWECKSQMETNYKFNHIEVICEGYDYADDDYVLIGSCGLEYTIDLVDPSQTGSYHQQNNYFNKNKDYRKSSPFSSFGYVLFIAGSMFIIYYVCLRKPNRSERSGDAPPPPPPGFRSDFFDSASPGYSGAGYSGNTYGYPSAPSYGTGTGNGFWSGMFTGGTLGYLFGQRNANYTDNTFNERQRQRSSDDSSYSSYGGSSGASSSTTTTSGFGGTRKR